MSFENNDFTKYIKPNLKKIQYFLILGGAENKIAETLGISYANWKIYKNKYPEFKEIIENAKLDTNMKVNSALLKKCLGYQVNELVKEAEYLRDKDNNFILNSDGTRKKKMVVTKTITKHVQPDFNSIRFWLLNRETEFWTDDKSRMLENIDNSGFLDILNTAIEKHADKKIELEKELKNEKSS